MPAPALSATELALCTGGRYLVHPLTFAIAQGERVALLGASGSGKSLTAAALAGMAPEGTTVAGEVSFPSAGTLPGAGTACLIRQNPASALNPLVPVGRQLALPLLRAGLNRREARAQAVRFLVRAGIDTPEHILPRYTGELSGGQLQRICIALALACGSTVLVADEPTTALDPVARLRVLATLRGWSSEGRSLLFITHDLAAAASLCTRAMVMAEGRIVEDVPMHELLHNPQHPYARLLVQAGHAATLPFSSAAAAAA